MIYLKQMLYVSTLEETDSLAPRGPIRIPPSDMARSRSRKPDPSGRASTFEKRGGRARGGGPDRSKSQDSHSGPTRAVETKIAPFTLSTLAPAVLPWRRLYPGLHRVTWWSIDLRPDADKALDRDRIARTDAGWLVVEQQQQRIPAAEADLFRVSVRIRVGVTLGLGVRLGVIGYSSC